MSSAPRCNVVYPSTVLSSLCQIKAYDLASTSLDMIQGRSLSIIVTTVNLSSLDFVSDHLQTGFDTDNSYNAQGLRPNCLG